MRYSFILPILFLCMTCSDSATKQQLVGNWNYDLDATIQMMQSQGAASNDLNYVQSILTGLQDATLSFDYNGTAHFQMLDLQEAGSWKLKGKEPMLLLTLDSNEQRYLIEFTSPDTLILAPPTEEEGFRRVLTRGE